VNTELIRVLTFLRSETVAKKAMQLIKNRKSPETPKWSELISRNRRYGGSIERMLSNHPPTREIGYAFMLRNLREGWSLNSRREYFEFLNAAAKTAGGNSFSKYLTRIRDEALTNCTNAEREALESITGEDFNPVPDFEYAAPVGPGQKWTVEAVSKQVKNKSNFERGRSLFFGAGCAQCHRVRGLGGSVGPDLTSVPNKFDRNYVIETIIHPSRNISDQYSSSLVVLADGRLIEGIVTEQDGGKVAIYPGKVGADPIVVAKDEVDEIRPSKVSQMPENLLDKLNAQELNDLMGYLMTGGDAKHRQFKK
jgi:putative heme-binding domain-containing protein